jgi:hypothetical protein
MDFIKKIFEKGYTPKITVEKIQHIFQYGKLKDMIGTGCSELCGKKVGDLICWKSEGYFYKGYKDIPAQDVPPHIQWFNNPVFAFVSIVDNKVRYYYSENGDSDILICPETTKISEIKLIDEIFETYYKMFNLPKSLKATKPTKPIKQPIDKSDKMKFLAEYLASSDADFFYDNFCGDDIYDIVMWVDWKEEDEDIVRYCEDIIKTGQLSAEVLNAENERGFDFVITYKNSKTNVPCKGKDTDIDTTIRTLNAVIQPDYEIRFCIESDGSDTLAFLPLSREQWKELDTKFANEIISKFKRITNKTKMFG